MMRHTGMPLVIAALIGSAVMAQSPIQERIIGKQPVPPLNERIVVKPLDAGLGAFAPPPSGERARIFGIVINELGVVVPSAGMVMVRSLTSGRVVSQAPVDAMGQFSLVGLDKGLYTAELVDATGTMLTTSPSFTLGLGEIVQLTPVISQSAFAGLASMLGTSTAGAISTAVSAGMMAMDTPAPISPVQ